MIDPSVSETLLSMSAALELVPRLRLYRTRSTAARSSKELVPNEVRLGQTAPHPSKSEHLACKIAIACVQPNSSEIQPLRRVAPFSRATMAQIL